MVGTTEQVEGQPLPHAESKLPKKQAVLEACGAPGCLVAFYHVNSLCSNTSDADPSSTEAL